MKTIQRYFVLLVILPLAIFLGSCSKTAENEHLPEYCQTYSGFMSTASKDLYELVGDINRYNYLSAISEIELEFEVDDPNREIDLDGIQCFQNLTSLTLIGQSFKDISPISALKNIQKIVLIDTSIVSIDSFKNLSKVNELTISNTKTLQSVDGVEEMTKLTRLDLSDNGIVNIDGLNNLVNLTELILSNNDITFFPSINQLELLETLDVSNNDIEELGADLSGLSNLIEFNARENNICDLSTLDDLVSLEILDLSENNLGCGGAGVSPDFSSLLNAPNLREIYLNDNNLTSIEDLRGKILPLEVLHLQNNNLTDITPIGNYTGIQELVLFNNNITNIDDLSGMINVTEIDLSENSITDFSDLLGIPNLEFIDLSDNNITFIPNMGTSWANLRVLNLQSNNLTNTAGVEGHPNLRELDISNNGLIELGGISNLPLLESLIIFWEIPDVIPEDFVFEDNPNNISVIRDSFNSLPSMDLADESDIFDFGFDLGPNVEIYNSISDIDNVGTIDFSGMDIDFIDELSINLNYLTGIDVSDNNITSIAFITGNPSLQRLDISENAITDLHVISGFATTDLDNLDQVKANDITGSNDLNHAFIYLPELSYIDLSGTNITSISNSFNNLGELTYLDIDSPVLESIVESFNDLFTVYTEDNVISFVNSRVGVISGSFNFGHYHQISFLDNSPVISETHITDSFNHFIVEHSTSIFITGNDFKTVVGSFNNINVVNLFLGDNNIESITTSFDGSTVDEELNIQNNRLQTLVGLSSITTVDSVDLSNNVLTTVAFLDGITGITSLDISNQFDSGGAPELTLQIIDGINDMPLLTELIMDDLFITEINGGFKNIGIDSFILSVSDNNGGIITSISADSFSGTPLTDLDLEGHNFTNIDFLVSLDILTDLIISIDMADLSDFQGLSLESTLESMTLENQQEVTDFSYLSDYDTVTFFSFTSALTLTINNFDGLDSLTNSNFENDASITTISNSFNDMSSLNLTTSYLDNYDNLANIAGSFDIYAVTDIVAIDGDINIVDSFNNVGRVDLNSGSETAVNFDTLSFDNMTAMGIVNSNYDSYVFLNGYTSLIFVSIDNLDKNITDLVNDNIDILNIANVSAIVTIIDIDISDTGTFTFGSTLPLGITVTADNDDFDMSSVGGTIILELDNTSVNLNGTLSALTVNSANLVTANLDSMETTNMTFNTDALIQITRDGTILNANVLEINSIETSLAIDVRTNTLNLYDSLANTFDLTVTGGNANLFTNQAGLIIDFTGEDLNIAYDTLETMNISGSFTNLIVDSDLLDEVNLNNTTLSSGDITSLQAVISIVGSNVSSLDLRSNNITDVSLTLGSAIVALRTTNGDPLNVDVTANILYIGAPNLGSITLDTASTLNRIDLTDTPVLNTLTYNNATVTDTHLVSDEAIITITGTNVADINLDADNLTNITLNAPSSEIDIDTLTAAVTGDIIATTVELDGANLTDITLTAASLITTMNVQNSASIDTLILDTANITTLNIVSNAVNLDVSAVNALETAISGDSFITVTTDLGTNNLTFDSGKTSSMSFDITATDVSLNSTLATISFDNASSIVNLDVDSDNLTNVLGGSATIGAMNITASSASLNITGSNVTTLTVNDPLITAFDANVGLSTVVNFTTNATSLITINTTSEDITVTAQGDIALTSATLTGSTVNIGSNGADFILTKAALDYTLNGTMGFINIDSSTMNNFIVGTGLTVSDLAIVNNNITSLDLSPGTISNLNFTSTNTAIDILGNDLNTIVLNMTNLNNLTVNSTNIGSYVSTETTAAALSINGAFSSATVIGNSLGSIDLNGTIDTVDITGSSLTSVDLTDATYSSLVLDTDILASLDTLTSISNSLEITTTIDEFNLTSNIPSISFFGGTGDNLNITTTGVNMNLLTRTDSVTLVAATTDLVIAGDNLNYVIGAAQDVMVYESSGGGNFVFDLDADSVIFGNNNYTALLFTGVRTIPTLDITSTSIATLNTNDVVITSLDYNSSGINSTVDTLATTINHTNSSGDEIIFNIETNSQTFNTNSEIVALSSGNISSTILNYSGAAAIDVTLSSLTTASINLAAANDITMDGNSTNVILSGTLIDTVNTDALTLTNKYTMNATLITDLEFVSATLLASISEIEVDTLTVANVGLIVTKLDSSGVTLFSPIVSGDIYDYFYDDEYLALSDQEAIDTLRYTGYRDTAIADALAELNSNEYFDYIDDPTLTTSIDTQTYLTMQEYFDGYWADEGYASEAAMVTALGQPFVDDAKAAIQATLDQAVLIIIEDDLNAAVVTSIEDDSDTHATTESANIGFNIG